MERYILLKNARIIDMSLKALRDSSILVRQKGDDRPSEIIAIGNDFPLPGGDDVMLRTVNLEGGIVCPSFIDMRCDICEPGKRNREDFSTLGNAAALGGYGALLALPVYEIDAPDETIISYITENEHRTAGVKIFPCAQANLENVSNFEKLENCGAVALGDDGSLSTEEIFKVMSRCAKHNILLVLHCEERSLSSLEVASASDILTRLAIPNVPRCAEEVAVARNLFLAEETCCRIHISHISTKNSAELIRNAKKRGVRVTCDTAVQYFALSENDLLFSGTSAKFSPPLRSQTDTLAIIEAIKDGTIDCISSDHLPRTEREKSGDFTTALPGCASLQTAFTVALDRLVMSGHIDIFKLISLFVDTPSNILGFSRKLEVGESAYLNVISLDYDSFFQRENIASKCKSSPFIETSLRGCLRYSLIDGQLYTNPDISSWI